MTARSVNEVMEALWRACGNDEEALAIAERFRCEATFAYWDEKRPMPQSGETVDVDEEHVQPGDILVYLTCSRSTSRKDPLAWISHAYNHHDNVEYNVLFIDDRPCHIDWLGLKLLSEICFLFEKAHGHELVYAIDPVLGDLDSDALQALLHRSFQHLSDKRRALTYRVLDRKMGGRIEIATRLLRSRVVRESQINEVVQRLSEDVFGLLRTTWQDPLNADERRARLELTRIATLGAVKRHLVTPPKSH